MGKFLKGLVGAAVLAGAAAVAYKTLLKPETQKKVADGAKQVLSGVQDVLKKAGETGLSVAQQVALEKNKAWIEEQWRNAGF